MEKVENGLIITETLKKRSHVTLFKLPGFTYFFQSSFFSFPPQQTKWKLGFDLKVCLVWLIRHKTLLEYNVILDIGSGKSS